ncbi:hypothetical protein RJT34_25354 [Clitoria ternatea]|uniref:PUM-HD domain-containing protein n=1 Tax=Clitoria ternatea TaxID=43366 RepID=A0AAN9FPT0_CLITE
MAQFMNDEEHPFPFMEEHEYSTTTLPHTNSVCSPSNTATMQDLVSNMQGLRLSHPYYRNTFGEGSSSGFHNYYPMTNHANDDDEATFYRTRILHAAATTRVPNYFPDYYSVGGSSISNAPYRRGLLVSMAMDKRKCHILQQKIENGKPEDIDAIISELKHHLHDLMKHACGNYVVQKFFQTSNVDMSQVHAVISFIISDVHKLKDVCMDQNGNRVIQKMVESIKTPEGMFAIVVAIRPITIPLVKNVNGGYVIQQCVMHFPLMYKKVILNEIAMNCVDVARDERGCRVMQRCLDYAEGEAELLILNRIISNAKVLAEDPFGFFLRIWNILRRLIHFVDRNYVVQYLVKRKMYPVNALIISRLRGYYVELSMNKYASNVVEDLLQFSTTEDAAIIVLELINSIQFFDVVQNRFGNYVAQTAIKCSKDRLRKRICNIILSHKDRLGSHNPGKMVLTVAEKSHCVHL